MFVIVSIIAVVVILLRGKGRGEKWADAGAIQVIGLVGIHE